MSELSIDGLTDLEPIARGGFSTVYRAREPGAGRDVAVKVLHTVLDEQGSARFERECQILGGLSHHPGICTLYFSGVTDAQRPYLVLELCTRSLAEQVRADGPFAWEPAVDMLCRVGDALQFAHEAGILHRDVKPENVLITRLGHPVVTDFGIARADDGWHTTTGLVTASIAHAAPETLDGVPATPASDVWSLASTGYQLLTGTSPFRRTTDESAGTVLARVFRDDPPDLRAQGVPAWLCDALEAAMAKDPGQRTSSMSELTEKLRAGLRGTPAPGEASADVRAARAARRRVASGLDSRSGSVHADDPTVLRAPSSAPTPAAASGLPPDSDTIAVARDRQPLGFREKPRFARRPVVAGLVVILFALTALAVAFARQPSAAAGPTFPWYFDPTSLVAQLEADFPDVGPWRLDYLLLRGTGEFEMEVQAQGVDNGLRVFARHDEPNEDNDLRLAGYRLLASSDRNPELREEFQHEMELRLSEGRLGLGAFLDAHPSGSSKGIDITELLEWLGREAPDLNLSAPDLGVDLAEAIARGNEQIGEPMITLVVNGEGTFLSVAFGAPADGACRETITIGVPAEPYDACAYGEARDRVAYDSSSESGLELLLSFGR